MPSGNACRGKAQAKITKASHQLVFGDLGCLLPVRRTTSSRKHSTSSWCVMANGIPQTEHSFAFCRESPRSGSEEHGRRRNEEDPQQVQYVHCFMWPRDARNALRRPGAPGTAACASEKSSCDSGTLQVYCLELGFVEGTGKQVGRVGEDSRQALAMPDRQQTSVLGVGCVRSAWA